MSSLSRETVRRALRAADPYETTKARYGPRVAQKLHGQFLSQLRADAPLNRVYIDHTQLDVYVRVYMGKGRWVVLRPWLTLVSDDNTGMVLGYALSFKAPRAEDVLAALRHAILPKAYTEQWVGKWLTFVWEVMGIPDEVIVDNGMDLQSRAVLAACLALGLSVVTAPPMEPWRRARAERLFGTLNTLLIHTLLGTTFGTKDAKKYEYDPKAFATLTDEHLHIALHITFEKMATRFHEGLRDFPIRRWREGTTRFPVMVPRSKEEFDAQMSLRYSRRIGKLGIEFLGHHYISEELIELKRKLGSETQVTVLVMSEDVRRILIVDPETLSTLPADCTTNYTEPLPLFVREAQMKAGNDKPAATPGDVTDQTLLGTDLQSAEQRDDRLDELREHAERQYLEDSGLTDRQKAHRAALEHRSAMQEPKPATDKKSASALLGKRLLGAGRPAPTPQAETPDTP